MRNQLPNTYDTMLAFSRAMTMEAVYGILLNRCADRGISSVLAGIIPKRVVQPSDQPKFVVLGHWPQEWAERYFAKQYVRRDPTIRHAARAFEPLLWSSLDISRPDEAASRIMHEAQEFRLRDGVTIPQLTLDGLRIGVSFAGDKIDTSPEAMLEYTILATYAVNRALQIRAGAESGTVQLSPRQRECLAWAADGRTAADIGDILGISTKIAERHLENARARLGAHTTSQAIATALRLGLLA
ncbi:MAG: autoinducer binding domain-containing protein [Burkholderiaceae bacterium]|nr:autoinducer binding domain-containing protein [Burkholderiaceae bacterium]